MVAHEKRNSAQFFCAVPTRNDFALSSLLFPAQPTQKLGYPGKSTKKIEQGRGVPQAFPGKAAGGGQSSACVVSVSSIFPFILTCDKGFAFAATRNASLSMWV